MISASTETGGGRRERAARALIVLTAALSVYFGLSSLLLPFLGEPGLHPGHERWVVLATGALQLAAAAAAFREIVRRRLGGAALGVAGCLFAGWLGMLPGALRAGLDFGGAAWPTSAAVMALPAIALTAAALAWRHPLLAAFVATAPTALGVAFTAVFAVVIAVHGF